MQKHATARCVLLVGFAALGCQPSLPGSPPGGGASSVDPPPEPRAVLEPEAPFDAAPGVVRVRIFPGDKPADASRALFVKGHVGPGHVRQVQNGDVSAALSERALPAVTWADEDGSIVIAPSAALKAGVTYGALSGEPALGVDVRAATDMGARALERVWPPAGAKDAGPFAILCGGSALPPPPATVLLDPGEVAAKVERGAFRGVCPACLRVDLVDAPEGGGAVLPALLELGDGSAVMLDPAPIAPGPPGADPGVEPAECAPGEVAFGPGCARVTDDRLLVTSPDTPLLWAIRSSALGDTARVTAASEPWTLLGLRPSTLESFAIAALTASGAAHTYALEVVTPAPMSHVVITEVLANPLGPEPDQEWVELYNDGLVEADLSGMILSDIGGKTPLPPAILPPRAYALVVNDSFVEDDDVDPRPAKGTRLLRVADLGKDGLKNDGEPLKLVGPDGAVLSRFPAAPKAKAGQSVARVKASAPDGDRASFVAAAPTPGAAFEAPP